MAAKKPKPVAQVTHWFDKISVAIFKIEKGMKLKVGDKVKIGEGDREFEETIGEIQLDRQPIDAATAGMEVGVKVSQKPKEHSKVYLV